MFCSRNLIALLGLVGCYPKKVQFREASTFFDIFLNGAAPKRGMWSEEKISKNFEIIMQPLVHTFDIALFFHF
jgi:hypothetical protein